MALITALNYDRRRFLVLNKTWTYIILWNLAFAQGQKSMYPENRVCLQGSLSSLDKKTERETGLTKNRKPFN